jgi:GNAT superfamily N-acetyltransferase
MSRSHVRPFEAIDIPDAGQLLAQRHRRHRQSQPLLDERFEDPETAAAEVAGAYAVDGASGAIATRDGRMVGFMIGAPKASPVWGPNVWIEHAGHAATDSETLRDLYATAAARWVDEGRTAHYVLVPASDEALVSGWFRLCFGQQHAHGLREATTSVPPPPADLIIRRATRADIPFLAALDVELPTHQGLSPTFSAGVLPTVEEAEADWQDDIENPDYAAFVAERDGKVVGSAVGCALTKSNSHAGLARPANAGFLGFAAVFPSARGSGAGRALGETVIAWSAASGFESVVTDWRVTNLLSSRAWPALGFEETFLRLHRSIGY